MLLIHRDGLRFRGNVVSIVTALLRMPLVGNKKNAAHHLYVKRVCVSHTCRTHTHTLREHNNTQKTQLSPACIFFFKLHK